MHTIAFIPARGGSKGLPRKNLARVGDVSLVGRAVRLALGISRINEVVVSSDDEEILAEARTHGAMIDRRSQELSADETPTVAVLREYVDRRPSLEALVLLQPTTPFRQADDVEACLNRLETATSVVTVAALEHPPEWSFRIGAGDHLEPLSGWDALVGRRQDAPPSFRLNGAVYAVRADRLRSGHGLVDDETVAVVMPADRSVDIDSELDLEFARLLFDRGHRDHSVQPKADGGRS